MKLINWKSIVFGILAAVLTAVARELLADTFAYMPIIQAFLVGVLAGITKLKMEAGNVLGSPLLTVLGIATAVLSVVTTQLETGGIDWKSILAAGIVAAISIFGGAPPKSEEIKNSGL